MANPLHIERMRSINFRLSHDCARIEAEYGVCAWSRDQIIDYLRQPNAFGKALINESGDVVLGYMLYHLSSDRIFIERILVRPESRRQGVGSAMLQRLKERVGVDGIRSVSLSVPMDDSDAAICKQYGAIAMCVSANGFGNSAVGETFIEFVYEG